jgi:hypothetical protein
MTVQAQASQTCYDQFGLGIITSEKDLFPPCFDYNGIAMKKKPQHKMGRSFQCRWPQEGAQLLKFGELQKSSNRKPYQVIAASNHHVPETEHNSKSHTVKRAQP